MLLKLVCVFPTNRLPQDLLLRLIPSQPASKNAHRGPTWPLTWMTIFFNFPQEFFKRWPLP